MAAISGRPKINANPKVYKTQSQSTSTQHAAASEARRTKDRESEDSLEPFDSLEIFDLIKDINDPEHPLTLEQLRVAQLKDIHVDNKKHQIKIDFTPTIPHCSMATLIGLSIRVKLLRSLPPRFKVDINIAKGAHNQEKAVNKQLNDKERVAAALENQNLLAVVDKCLAPKTQ
mmetsp:Transcript_19804/g.35324  ORF Transcript_19804/g.35324 Transcript_19804/m.35324 type:complete len:173 (+) Transcript_19804:171-689(+)|eukprot:CAMPEP_0197542282 /NCGR_PEP_ID=MMETSP1318-20131121/67621_1 /TAXON_ID=552666 /ORGANISM="Partenskyella glossopodia, Strain RCC365" /LENGTH=172 /DNA_ID=CAMNT_0043101535 /DNA_START=228 /DNA_END=746 /DNA_ORIENTATION=-